VTVDAKRKICVLTGTRAEYGLLFWIMRELQRAEDVALQLVVTGTHLDPAFGNTVELIEADGFLPDARIPLGIAGDDNAAIGQAMGRALLGCVDAFKQLAPDILVLLGDRFEVLAAASAATALRVPIAHIHGGEITEGAMDEQFRHAVTKMAHLHFVAAAEYGKRVVQLGEAPERVFNVGALGIDNFVRLELPDRAALAKELGLDLSGQLFLITYHPATLGTKSAIEGLDELLAALDRYPRTKLIFTKANADAGGRAINDSLEMYAAGHPGRAMLVASLGQANYLGMLKAADLVIGNSSSGIIEAPAAGTPTVNIGTRQTGRLRARSIVDCAEDRDAIAQAIEQALSPAFRRAMTEEEPPYGRARDAARQVTEVLRRTPLEGIVIKKFHDVGFG
jgi:UDP-hydrolysing UDP-N-acetyl-D-glucosamine 2-epimerase